MKSALAILTAGLLLAATPPAGNDGVKQELEKFQGHWLMAAETAAGIPAPAKKLKGRKLVITGNRYFAESPVTGGEKGTFTIDPTQRPKSMDSSPSEEPNRGRKRLAIYEINGDSLKLCYTAFGGARPKAFVSEPGSETILVIYKRANP
jgi:uncharacterized protein (TIGR03067 family)